MALRIIKELSKVASNRFNSWSKLGVGIGLRAPHYAQILSTPPALDWFEIISENYLLDGGRPLRVLDKVLERYPIIQHGVSMYFGSTDPLNRDHLARLKNLVRRTGTPWLTDHLCWGSVDGRYTHDLLPLPYTREAIEVAAAKIRQAQDFLEIPVAIENVSSYAEYRDSEMPEWQFVSEVAERADCGILLDVNNIYVSSQNHAFDPFAYLRGIPMERVAQIHLAGYSTKNGYLLDTHDHAVSGPVWKLYEHAIGVIGPTPTLLEWDDEIPALEVVVAEANKAKQRIEHLSGVTV